MTIAVKPKKRYGKSQTERYLRERQETGMCETCKSPMATHDRCQACNILCGVGHEDTLYDFRDKNICGSCVVAWLNRDKELGREATWEEFICPSPKDKILTTSSGFRPIIKRYKGD